MVKNLSGLVLATILFTLVSCASKPREMDKMAQIHFNAGTQSLLTRDYTEALKRLLQANELEKDNADILNNLGMAYYFKGENELALRCLKRAIELNEKNSDARSNIASIYYQTGRVPEAESLYKEVLKDLTYEKQARTFYNLGILELEKKGNSEAAEKYFRSSLKESDDYCPSHFQIGKIQFARRQYNKAHTSFRDATMGACLNSGIAHYNQALALIELRRYTDARMKLDEIQRKFKSSAFSAKAQQKLLEIDDLEKNFKTLEARNASRKMLESPEF